MFIEFARVIDLIDDDHGRGILLSAIAYACIFPVIPIRSNHFITHFKTKRSAIKEKSGGARIDRKWTLLFTAEEKYFTFVADKETGALSEEMHNGCPGNCDISGTLRIDGNQSVLAFE
jgi:hypothetical protein